MEWWGDNITTMFKHVFHCKLGLRKYEMGVIILWRDMIWLKICRYHVRMSSKNMHAIDLWLLYPHLTSIEQFKVSPTNLYIKYELQGLQHFHLQVIWLLQNFDHVIQMGWIFYICVLHPRYPQNTPSSSSTSILSLSCLPHEREALV